MAHKEIKAYCPTCGRYICVRLDDGEYTGTVLNHKFNGAWCKGGFGEDKPPSPRKPEPWPRAAAEAMAQGGDDPDATLDCAPSPEQGGSK